MWQEMLEKKLQPGITETVSFVGGAKGLGTDRKVQCEIYSVKNDVTSWGVPFHSPPGYKPLVVETFQCLFHRL